MPDPHMNVIFRSQTATPD